MGENRLSPPLRAAPSSAASGDFTRRVNVSQILSVDKDLLTARAGRLPGSKLELVLSGIDTVLGR
jgi:mRNA-degrading endonuclease toxin of MazEF toxin-antitoxin module